MALSSHLASVTLLKQMRDNLLDPKLLSQRDRVTIVTALRAEGTSAANMAAMLKVSDRTIYRDLRRIESQQAHLVKFITKERLAGEIIAWAHIIRQRALASGDNALAWQVTLDLPETLAKYRFVELDKVPERSEITMKREDLSDDELVARLTARGSQRLN